SLPRVIRLAFCLLLRLIYIMQHLLKTGKLLFLSMEKEEALYLETGRSLDGAQESQMFGKPCFKINTKAFICFFQNSLVCKLSGDDHKKALSLKGAVLFDPSGKNRPMKEWVQVPFEHKSKWKNLAKSAYQYVSG